MVNKKNSFIAPLLVLTWTARARRTGKHSDRFDLCLSSTQTISGLRSFWKHRQMLKFPLQDTRDNEVFIKGVTNLLAKQRFFAEKTIAVCLKINFHSGRFKIENAQKCKHVFN